MSLAIVTFVAYKTHWKIIIIELTTTLMALI